MLGINGGSMKQNHVECHLLKLFHGGYLEETPFSVYVLGNCSEGMVSLGQRDKRRASVACALNLCLALGPRRKLHKAITLQVNLM